MQCCNGLYFNSIWVSEGAGHGISRGSLGSGNSIGHVSEVAVNGVRFRTWQSIVCFSIVCWFTMGLCISDIGQGSKT
ncbi:hypothetical protein CsSME_00007339 [Camellia sinensis var. sinensis]